MLCFKTYFNSGLIGPVLKFCKGFIKYSYLQIQEKYFKNSKKTIEKSEKKTAPSLRTRNEYFSKKRQGAY